MAAVMQNRAERPEEARLSYPFDTVPQPGEVFEVAGSPGARVRWLRMSLPFALDHVNLWLLEDEIEGRACWTAVDCGVGLKPTRDAWETIFAQHLDGLPIGRVICTHAHPDHIGNAAWLCERFADAGCGLTATAGEYLWARVIQAGLPGLEHDAQVAHFCRNGLSAEMGAEIGQNRKSYYATLVPALPHAFHRMRRGDVITIGGRAWRVATGFGHSAEHATLFCEELDLVISGDMLLPRISTNVGVWPNEPDANPLAWFLESLGLYEQLSPSTLVLPSHGRLFRGAAERVAQLRAHHADRLAETLAACDTPTSAGDILPRMFHRKLDAHQTTFAIGEALAHLHYLKEEGKVARRLDADGVYRFVRAA
jgi:glyoxylase-like metal-dependent hydrolase (beta-lactamase superfamily II)